MAEYDLIEGMVIQVLPPNRLVVSLGTNDGVTHDMVFAVRFERSDTAAEKVRVRVVNAGRNQTVCETDDSPLPNIVAVGDYVHEVPSDETGEDESS